MCGGSPKETGKGAAGSSSSGGSGSGDIPLYQSFGDTFGIDWQTEGDDDEEDHTDHTDLQPVMPPAWLEGALDFASETGDLLVGQQILYRFAHEEGGWSVGLITHELEDENDTIEGTDGTLTGDLPCNFAVEYEDGIINHLLSMDDYATCDQDAESS
jgi:hypothetical protein